MGVAHNRTRQIGTVSATFSTLANFLAPGTDPEL